MATGANAMPLGKLHPALAGKRPPENDGLSDAALSMVMVPSMSSGDIGMGCSLMQMPPPSMGGIMSGMESHLDRKRKKRSRWGDDVVDKINVPGMPTVLPPGLTKDQERAYIVQLQIEDLNRKLRTGDLGIPSNPEERLERLLILLTVTFFFICILLWGISGQNASATMLEYALCLDANKL